jgi:phosphate transport system substrate-binding protein
MTVCGGRHPETPARRWPSAVLATWFVVGAAALGVASSPGAAQATSPHVDGAGSTWVQIALDQWRADYARQGFTINYQGLGSSAGRSFYIIGEVDFAASEIPFQPDEVAELQGEHKSYQYLPDVAGGTSLIYNLHDSGGNRIRSLRLDANAAAGIFTGKITSWQDPAIKALNPGLTISETTVTPVIRSDGSGTSAQFSLYLDNQAHAVWQAFIHDPNHPEYYCPAPCSQWPSFPGSIGAKGSDGVTNFVSNPATGNGSIGYVEAGYAFGVGFPVASLHNRSGSFAQPTSTNVATALTHATLNQDLTQNLDGVYNAPEPNAYPMSSYSYMITPTANFDPAKGAVLGGWIIYIACAGQQEAAPLGYSPLPANLIKADFDAVNRIPGHPPTPPIDYAHCANPNLPHSGGSTTPPGGGSTTPPGGGSTTPPGGGSTTTPGGGTTAPGGSSGGLGGGTPGGGAFGGGQQLPPGAQVTTLDGAGRQAAFERGLKAASYAQPKPVMPLVVTALGVLLLVFTPVVLQVRRDQRSPRTVGATRRSPPGAGAGQPPLSNTPDVDAG